MKKTLAVCALLATTATVQAADLAPGVTLDTEIKAWHKVDAETNHITINPEVEGLSLPQELMTVARNLAAHVWHGSDLLMTQESRALLKQRYIHHSDHYLKLGPIYPFKPAKYGKRAVHPNEGQWIEGQYNEY